MASKTPFHLDIANGYGSYDLTSGVPTGYTYIPSNRIKGVLERVCEKAGIKYASALIYWQRSGLYSRPIHDGVLVSAADASAIDALWQFKVGYHADVDMRLSRMSLSELLANHRAGPREMGYAHESFFFRLRCEQIIKKRFVDEGYMAVSEIAKALGKSESTVRRKLSGVKRIKLFAPMIEAVAGVYSPEDIQLVLGVVVAGRLRSCKKLNYPVSKTAQATV